LSFSALKKLTLLDPAEASGIADNIMTNYASESDFRISAAQKSIARALKESNNKDRKQMFVKQCAEIFETGSSVTKDSSVFALSDMRDSNAITYILSNESIDRELKVFAIDQNANTLKKMISGNPSENDVRIAVDAMEILPLNDLLDELKAVQEKLEDPALKIRCEKAIAEIQQNGVDANQKWNQQ
jgi:hypothetical protein